MEKQSKKSDLELGRELKQGNPEAFNEAVEKFIRPIYSICLKWLNDPIEAQDATQDVFLRMCKSIDTYDASKPLSSWLFRIAHNRCMDAYKKKGRNLSQLMLDTQSERQTDPEPIDGESNDQLAKLVWDSLDEIHESYKMILLFKYKFNMSNSEIAQEFGINENSFRVKLFRAKQELRAVVQAKLLEGKKK